MREDGLLYQEAYVWVYEEAGPCRPFEMTKLESAVGWLSVRTEDDDRTYGWKSFLRWECLVATLYYFEDVALVK